MDHAMYDRYILNGKPENGPWLLSFAYLPYSSSGRDFSMTTNSVPTALCFGRAFNVNVAFLDYRIHEDIFESYNYKTGWLEK